MYMMMMMVMMMIVIVILKMVLIMEYSSKWIFSCESLAVIKSVINTVIKALLIYF